MKVFGILLSLLAAGTLQGCWNADDTELEDASANTTSGAGSDVQGASESSSTTTTTTTTTTTGCSNAMVYANCGDFPSDSCAELTVFAVCVNSINCCDFDYYGDGVLKYRIDDRKFFLNQVFFCSNENACN